MRIVALMGFLFLFAAARSNERPFLLRKNLAPYALNDKNPYAPRAPYATWGIKGKILPWLLGNGSGTNILLGVEHSIFKNHSLGLDLFFIGQENTHDGDPNKVPVIPATGFYGLNRALFVNYRYYLPLKKLREKQQVLLYTGLFANYGRLWYSYDHGYWKGYSNNTTTFFNSFYHGGGWLLGTLFKISEEKNLWMDVNLGFMKKISEVYSVYETDTGDAIAKDHFNTFNVRMGLNLYWVFYH